MPSYDINKHNASARELSPSLRTKGQGPEIVTKRANILDSDEYQKRFKKLMQWRRQARVAQADNRMEMAIDEDFYDGIQMEPEDLRILMERSQAPEIFNVVKNTINFILGTERKSRIDYRVLPRKKTGASMAKTKTKCMKYVDDCSKATFERSQAFTECVCAGIGWLEFGARNTDEILFTRSERWRNMWYDHLSVNMDGLDMRFINREKWVDLDVAKAMFPDREQELKSLSEGVNSLYPYLPDDTVITDNASEFDLESDLDSLFGGPFDGMRERLKIVEMQYRMPDHVQILKMRDEDTPFGALQGAIYRPGNPDHDYLVKGGYFSTSDAYKMVVRYAMWAGRTLLQDKISPYNHNRFSFQPIYCYRRKRDNMPYGVIRDIRDPQSDLNKRKSKALFLSSAKQIVLEKTATDDIVAFHDELQKPDGIAIVNDGAMKRWKEIENQALSEAHLKMAQDDERFIHSLAGVTADADWQEKKDLSGKAINLVENQSLTGHGVVFDNLWYALQAGGEIQLSNIEQFYDKKKEIRITGDQQKDDFVNINQPDEEGKMDNFITAQKSDFLVSKQDYRETIRQAMIQQLLDLINNLAKVEPKIAVALLDLVVELMDDLPNKDEAVARIRKINGQHAPEDEMDEKEKAQAEQMKKEQAIMKQIQFQSMQAKLAEQQAKAATEQTKALDNQASAILKKLDAFLKAMEAAGTLGAIPALAQAADTLLNEAQGAGQEQTQQQPGNGKGGPQ